MPIVAVGSNQATKRQAAELAFCRMMPNEANANSAEWKFISTPVSSGIRKQPVSDCEGILGARNRARTALNEVSDGEFGVGIEGTLEMVSGICYLRTWSVVINDKGDEGSGAGPSVFVPANIVSLIRQGYQLGEAIEKTSGIPNARGEYGRSEEHTSELQSRLYFVCPLL